MAASDGKKLPLVYSCSGASSAAQMANYIAVRLDRTKQAEMSCIVGVGGDVPSLVKVATAGRPIVAVDGCILSCVKMTLARHGVEPVVHYGLQDYKVKKAYHADFDQEQADELLQMVAANLPPGEFPVPAAGEQAEPAA